MRQPEIVITGIGVASPLGIGRGEFWSAILEGRSGVGPITLFDTSGLPVRIAAEVRNFDAKKYVANRKSLKVMSRDAQLGMAAAALAGQDAGVSAGTVDPERFGVVLGADRICNTLEESESAYRRCIVDGGFQYGLWGTEGLAGSFPLGFLRVLPNMIASHVSIAHDARGPNNTVHQAEVSSLLAVGEAAAVIQRGAADMMLAGGASSQLHPFDCVRRCALGILSPQQDDPTAVMRPFDAGRDGQVWGEGAAVFVLESRVHAEARGAKILARLLGWASAGPMAPTDDASVAAGLCRAMQGSLDRAGLDAKSLGHINAHGTSSVRDDRIEARAIGMAAPAVPVTAPKSRFGNLGAAAGAMEMAVSVLALAEGLVPLTLNYRCPDPECLLPVVHGQSLSGANPAALVLSWTPAGQAASLVLAADL